MNFETIKTYLNNTLKSYVNSPFSFNITTGPFWYETVDNDQHFNSLVVDTTFEQIIFTIFKNRINYVDIKHDNNPNLPTVTRGSIKHIDTEDLNEMMNEMFGVICEYDLEDSEVDDGDGCMGNHEQMSIDYKKKILGTYIFNNYVE